MRVSNAELRDRSRRGAARARRASVLPPHARPRYQPSDHDPSHPRLDPPVAVQAVFLVAHGDSTFRRRSLRPRRRRRHLSPRRRRRRRPRRTALPPEPTPEEKKKAEVAAKVQAAQARWDEKNKAEPRALDALTRTRSAAGGYRVMKASPERKGPLSSPRRQGPQRIPGRADRDGHRQIRRDDGLLRPQAQRRRAYDIGPGDGWYTGKLLAPALSKVGKYIDATGAGPQRMQDPWSPFEVRCVGGLPLARAPEVFGKVQTYLSPTTTTALNAGDPRQLARQVVAAMQQSSARLKSPDRGWSEQGRCWTRGGRGGPASFKPGGVFGGRGGPAPRRTRIRPRARQRLATSREKWARSPSPRGRASSSPARRRSTRTRRTAKTTRAGALDCSAGLCALRQATYDKHAAIGAEPTARRSSS